MELIKFDDREIKKADEIIKSFSDIVLSGEVQPAIAGVVFRRMEKVIEEVKKNPLVKEAIINDTRKYLENGKSGICFGSKVTIAATYTTYDFEVCKDKRWDAYNTLEIYVKERKKLIEEELKLLLKEDEARRSKATGLGIGVATKDIAATALPVIKVDESTGEILIVMENDSEMFTVYPPTKIQTEGIKYSDL